MLLGRVLILQLVLLIHNKVNLTIAMFLFLPQLRPLKRQALIYLNIEGSMDYV